MRSLSSRPLGPVGRDPCSAARRAATSSIACKLKPQFEYIDSTNRSSIRDALAAERICSFEKNLSNMGHRNLHMKQQGISYLLTLQSYVDLLGLYLKKLRGWECT